MTQSYTPRQIADGLLAGEFTRDSAFVPLAEVERLREVLLHISRYETVGPAGFEWDIVVEELVAIARDALEAKP